MSNPVPGDGPAQDCRDVVLDEQVCKALRTVTAGEGNHTTVNGER